MKPAAAPRVATSVDAEFLGLLKSRGTLEPGKLTDMVAVPRVMPADFTATFGESSRRSASS